MSAQRFPSNGQTDGEDLAATRADVRSSFIKYVAGVWLVAAALFPFYRLLTEMVAEKETRIREAMKMMGLSVPAYWATWFGTAAIMTFGTAALNAALLHWSLVIEYTDVWLTIALYILFNCSVIPFCFFLRWVCFFFFVLRLCSIIFIIFIFYIIIQCLHLEGQDCWTHFNGCSW